MPPVLLLLLLLLRASCSVAVEDMDEEVEPPGCSGTTDSPITGGLDECGGGLDVGVPMVAGVVFGGGDGVAAAATDDEKTTSTADGCC